MVFSEWLFNELNADGELPEGTVASDLTDDFLADNCDITTEEMEDLKRQYQDWCADNGCDPEFDID